MQTLIIGAGPVGCHCGYHLAKKSRNNKDTEVTIVEEHNNIGEPVECAGLISRNLDKISRPKKSILNQVSGAVISCKNTSFELLTKKKQAYVIDRAVYDREIADKAEKAGCIIKTNTRYLNHRAAINIEKGRSGRAKLLNTKNKRNITLGYDYLIGADGAASNVAKNSGLWQQRKFLASAQVTAEFKRPFFDRNLVYLYLDRKYSANFFAWLIPINESMARVGLSSSGKTAVCFKNFMEHINKKAKENRGKIKILDRGGGIIPIYDKIRLQENNTFLVGDSALQVKATTGGGVVNGMLAAERLAESITENKSYERSISEIRRNLNLHLFIRNSVNKMDDKDIVELIKRTDNEKTKDLLKTYGDMDFPKRFFFRLLMKNPYLALKIFKSLL